MRILVVGAGAVGGFFGGRLAAAGRDVTFLVRPARAEALRAGLVVHGIEGDLRVDHPATVTATGLAASPAPYDIVLLAVKSFALDQALVDIAPAVGPRTTVIPLQNGMRHLDLLRDRFPDRVVGGLCFVTTTLHDDGSVRQLGPLQTIVIGDLADLAGAAAAADDADADAAQPTARILAAHEALSGAGFEVRIAPDIRQALWEKWFVLAAGGALTTLLGADVGTIEAVPHGAETARAILVECAAVAEAAGHPPRSASYERAEHTLAEPGSTFTTSLFRDRAAGLEVEADQILGDLVARGQAAGLSVPLLAAADAALEIYRASRRA